MTLGNERLQNKFERFPLYYQRQLNDFYALKEISSLKLVLISLEETSCGFGAASILQCFMKVI